MKKTAGTPDQRSRSRAQIVVIFAMSIIAFVGLCAVVIDISWYWSNNLRMQRAADAAALAGVVWLPGNVSTAVTVAQAEAAKNGFTNGTGSVTVTPTQDSLNNRRLKVHIEGDVGTFFARVLGLNTFHATADSKAEYVLPVPMGSPENYYGVFGKIRHPGGGVTTYNNFNNVSTSTFNPSTTVTGGKWTTPGNVYTSDNTYATDKTANDVQGWKGFPISLNSSVQNIDGITVQIEAKISAASTSCQIAVDLSWDGGSTWTTGAGTGVKTSTALTTSDVYQTYGSSTDKWNRTWSTGDLTTTNNFAVRAKVIKSTTANCAAAVTESIDHVRVIVTYDYQTSTFTPDVNVASPYGAALTPRGFWGTMLTQGAENINGDAYSPFYDTRTGTTNPAYGGNGAYYDYAVDMASGSTNGEVWIFDPGMCAVASDMGTGDRYFGNTNTNGSNEVSAYYMVYDTKNTLYDTSDDTLVATSGNTFANMAGSDESMNGPALSGGNLTDCSAAAIGSNTASPFYYHNRWWQLASGLSANKTYRVHVQSTDPSNINAQKNMNGQNSFAIWTKATGTAPKVHGLGAMEAYSPLDPSTSSVFYLAQIGAEHAGKTMEIKLWDPGDTSDLPSNIQILIPGTAGYTTASLNYTAAKGTTNSGASNCNSSSGTGVSSITTNTGGTMLFNGCWITILIPIPTTYTAPTPPGEAEPGWWKIKYNVGASSGGNTPYDLTTWQVAIRGNPVHLILP